MLKVKKTTYGSLPKNNEFTKLTTEIKQAIQKLEEEKSKKNKQDNKWSCKINSSNKKRVPEVSSRKWTVKKKTKKNLEDKHLTTDLINHHRK